MIQFPDLDALEEDEVSLPGVHYFYEETDFVLNDDNENIANWIRQTVVSEGKTFYAISYIFCSDEYLHKINLEYLDHDDYTDVITFPYSEHPVEGDIFISIERIRENAILHQCTFEQELHRVMVHGALHLCGHTDKTTEQRAAMTSKEDFYLSKR